MGDSGSNTSRALFLVSAALQSHVGRGKIAVCDLEDQIPYSGKTIQIWRAGDDARPSIDGLFALIEVLPESFLNEIIGALGFAPTYRVNGPHLATGEMLATLAAAVHDLADKWADGILDHRERAALKRDLPALIAELSKFLNAMQPETEGESGFSHQTCSPAASEEAATAGFSGS